MSRWPKKSSDEKRHDAWLASQETTTRCAFCDWEFVGSAEDGQAASVEHRRETHPDRVTYKRPNPHSLCKRDGCTAPRVDTAGRYAGLCAKHRERAKADAELERRARADRRPRRVSSSTRALLTSEMVAEGRRRHEAGESIHSIATLFHREWGYSSEKSCAIALRAAIERAGGKVTKRPWKSSRITPARVEVIRKVIAANVNVHAFSELVFERWDYASARTAEASIYDQCRRHAIELPRRRRPVVPELNRREVMALLDEADGAAKPAAPALAATPTESGASPEGNDGGQGPEGIELEEVAA